MPIAVASMSAVDQVCRWPWRLHQSCWPLVQTVRVAVTEMTANWYVEAV
jgi:hypothetical protein